MHRFWAIWAVLGIFGAPRGLKLSVTVTNGRKAITLNGLQCMLQIVAARVDRALVTFWLSYCVKDSKRPVGYFLRMSTRVLGMASMKGSPNEQYAIL